METGEEESYQLMIPVENDSKPGRRRRPKSSVWQHFTVESVSEECKRAFCNTCRKSFAYSTVQSNGSSKVAGTSHLRRHVDKGSCRGTAGMDENGDGDQTTAGKASRKRRDRSTGCDFVQAYDPEACRRDMARMIVMHDYPLDMVEHAGFRSFVESLQPRFGAVSFGAIRGECVSSYLSEKEKVMRLMETMPGRVCLALDVCTSRASVGYVFITGYFTDGDWRTQKWILNVVQEPYPDSHNALSHAVACCLSDWRLESRLFSLTLNHPVPRAGLESLRSHLCVKNPNILDGQLLLGQCIYQTFAAMASDVLSAGRDIVKKIRDNIKYVKTMENHEERFLELKQQLQVPSEVGLLLDDESRWDTTYQMLASASDLKEVFSCLDTVIPEYKEAPTMEDWKQVETICTHLKPLFDATSKLVASLCPPAITLFQEAFKIHSQIACAAATSIDPFVASFIRSLQEKLEKYWRQCGLVLAISVVMDPRFKMKLVGFVFSKIYGAESPLYVKMVDDGLHELFEEYLSLPLPSSPAYGSSDRAHDHNQLGSKSEFGLADFDVYIMETSQQLKPEIDQYLDEYLESRGSDFFDVLEWWKLNRDRYPTMSKMARDILSIPVSTTSPESVYSMRPRELSSNLSSAQPETLEALVCTKDWLQHGLSEDFAGVPDSMLFDLSHPASKMEF